MFMNFYNLSPLLIMLRLCSHIKVVSGYNNIQYFIYDFVKLSHLCWCWSCHPNSLVRGPQGSPLKIVLDTLNPSWKYALSTPTIRCVWSIICTYFYRLFPFTIFYDILRFFMIGVFYLPACCITSPMTPPLPVQPNPSPHNHTLLPFPLSTSTFQYLS